MRAAAAASTVGSGVAVSSGSEVCVGSAVGCGVATPPRAVADTSATTISVPAGKPSTSDVNVSVRPAPRRFTTTVPPSNSYVFSLRTSPIWRSETTSPPTLPAYRTPLPVFVALRATISAVTTPPSSSTPYASAWAVADNEPLTVVETATMPPPNSMPSGVRDGTLRDVPSSPVARTRATRPSEPDTAAASAVARDSCAGAAETRIPVAAAITANAARIRIGIGTC